MKIKEYKTYPEAVRNRKRYEITIINENKKFENKIIKKINLPKN